MLTALNVCTGHTHYYNFQLFVEDDESDLQRHLNRTAYLLDVVDVHFMLGTHFRTLVWVGGARGKFRSLPFEDCAVANFAVVAAATTAWAGFAAAQAELVEAARVAVVHCCVQSEAFFQTQVRQQRSNEEKL